jgi:hypothetical protein
VQNFRNRIPNANVLEEFECRFTDALDIPLTQGFVGTTRHSRLNSLSAHTCGA